MKKFRKEIEGWLAIIWGIIWTATITFGSVAILIVVTKWLLRLMGVM